MDADSVALLERAGNRLSITAVLGKSSAYCGAAPEADAPGEPDLDASLTRTDSDDIYISLPVHHGSLLACMCRRVFHAPFF